MKGKSVLPVILRFLLRLIISVAILMGIIVLLQDFHLYPRLASSYFQSKIRDPKTLPRNVQGHFLNTVDGKRIEIWNLPAENEDENTPVAIIFHGNAGTIDGFYNYQLWLRSLGISSWAVEYRGFGKSSGWPREKKIYSDSLELLDFIKREKKAAIRQLVVVGISVGTGPAAYLAQKANADVLVTFAAYTSIPDMARRNPVLRFVAPLAWTIFPVKKYISNLTDTCVVAIHGQRDQIIPFEYLAELQSVYSGSGGFFPIISDRGRHMDMLDLARQQINAAIEKCLKRERS